MRKFTYAVQGTAADNQTWIATGELPLNNPGDFPLLLHEAIGDAFMQLTRGQAQYGKPGVGCQGPYQITRFLVEVAKDA